MVVQISPSQMNDFEPAFGGCNRKWAWKKINKLEDPGSDATRLGSAVHKQHEDYYNLKKVPDQTTKAGRIAINGLHLMPANTDPTVKVEGEFRFNGLYGTYRGYKDLTYQDEKTQLPVVHDHKTTSAAKWMKTPETLENDPQAIIYAHDHFLKHPQDTQVILRWLYFFTKALAKPAQLVELTVTREFIADRFINFIEPIAKQIAWARLVIKDARQLPFNAHACGAYGGCPFQKHCNLTPEQKAKMLMTTNAKSAQDLLNELQGAAQTQGAPPGPPPLGALVGLNVPVTQDQPLSPAINPPVLPPQGAPVPAAAPAPLAAHPGIATPPVPQAPIGAPPAPIPQNQGEAAIQQAGALAPPPLEDKPRTRGGRKPKAAPAAKGYTLFIDCVPLGEKVFDANELIDSTNAEVCEAKNVMHYKLLPYGEGPGLLMACLDVNISKADLKGNVMISSSAADALPAFQKHAARIVMPTR